MKTRWKQAAFALLIAGLVAPLLPVPGHEADAAVPKLDRIRVALMLENGRLKSTAATIAISSAKGLNVQLLPAGTSAASGAAGASGAVPWTLAAATPAKLRSAPDGYTIRFLTTTDYSKAKTLADTLAKSTAGGTANNSIAILKGGDYKTFTVASIGYTAQTDAAQALAAYSQLPAVAALSAKPTLGGANRLQAGSGYAGFAEAEQARAALAQAGIDAVTGLAQRTGGTPQYVVLTGAEADAASLQAYQQQVQKLSPSTAFTPLDAASTYAVAVQDATGSSDGIATTPLLLYGTQNAKLIVSPLEGELTVVEKSNRTYRGQAELSVYGGKLALINELPFEEYLYSVVSGEMGKGWPAEALKAQAVAARTYALKSGTKYQVAQVSDTTLDQVYNGNEDADSVRAVDATKGEVLIDEKGLIGAYFSSNAGGMTSAGADVWGTNQSYLKVKPSPDDGAAKSKPIWKHVVLPTQRVAYIHSDYLKLTGQWNAAGLPVYQITEQGVNARSAPYVDNTNNPPIAKLNAGDRVTVFGEAQESNDYKWTRGPYTPEELLKLLNANLPAYKQPPIQGALTSLEVTARGESGRVTELTANGSARIKLASPDSFRTLLGSLPSTRFEIGRTGGYTMVGAGGQQALMTQQSAPMAVSAAGPAQAVNTDGYFVMNGSGQVDYATAETQYVVNGTGNGHGLGLSQWGARGFAELGYDYRYILNYYYDGVTITKE